MNSLMAFLFLLVCLPTHALRVNTLFIIDNSGSMNAYHQKVFDNIDLYFKHINTHKIEHDIALLSTSASERYYTYVKAHESGPNWKFKYAVKELGIKGSGIEQPMDSFQNSLSKLIEFGFFINVDFFNIVIITDEDDQSVMSVEKFIKDLDTYTYGVYSVNLLANKIEQQPKLTELSGYSKVYAYDIQDDFDVIFEEIILRTFKYF